MGPGLRAGTGPAGAPSAGEVRDLYAEASRTPPLSEPSAVADSFAALYGQLLGHDDVVWAAARSAGRLTGFAYGRPWEWPQQADPWSQQLWERLGDRAEILDDTLAVYLLAVSPEAQRRGLGRRLLRLLLATARTSRAWLQTRDEETPARALYRAEGWWEVGHGPDAPDGRPGLVMARPQVRRHPTAS